MSAPEHSFLESYDERAHDFAAHIEFVAVENLQIEVWKFEICTKIHAISRAMTAFLKTLRRFSSAARIVLLDRCWNTSRIVTMSPAERLISNRHLFGLETHAFPGSKTGRGSSGLISVFEHSRHAFFAHPIVDAQAPVRELSQAMPRGRAQSVPAMVQALIAARIGRAICRRGRGS